MLGSNLRRRYFALVLSALLSVLVSPLPATADAVGQGGVFVPTAYARLSGLDSALAPGERRDIQVLGVAGVPSTGVAAVLVDVTASSTTASGTANVRVWTAGVQQPTFSAVQVTSATAPATATLAVMPGPDGKLSVSNSLGSTQVNVDVQGYFTSASSSGVAPGGFVPVKPSRVWDTADTVALAPGEARTISVASAGIPASASAVFASVGARETQQDGHLRVVPAGGNLSNAKPFMNYSSDVGPQEMGGALQLGGDRSVTVYNGGTSSVRVTLDVQGYFAGVSNDGGGFSPTQLTSLGSVTIPAGGTQNVAVGGTTGVPLYGAAGVMLSLRTKDAQGTGNGYLYTSPAGAPSTSFSTLQWVGSQAGDHSTTTVLRPGDHGEVTLRNDSDGAVTVSIQVQGWFSAPPVIPAAETDAFIAAAVAHGATEDQARQAVYNRDLAAGIVVDVTEASTESATEPWSEQNYKASENDLTLEPNQTLAGSACKKRGHTLSGVNRWGDLNWQFTQTMKWCWANGNFTLKYSTYDQSSPGYFWVFKGLSQTQSTSTSSSWIRKREGHFEQCIPTPIGEICSHDTYASIEHTVHPGGTWSVLAEVS